MPTIIDALKITLELDTSQFSKAQKEAAVAFTKTRETAVKEAKEIEKAAKTVTEGLRSVGLAALSMFAVFTGSRALGDFVGNLLTADAALGRFSQRIGVSPQALKAWENAAERVGGSADATAASFQKAADALNALHTQGQNLPLAFYQLQAAARTRVDTEHGPIAYMEGLAKAAGVVAKTDPSKAAFFLQQIGIDQGTINLMLQGGTALDRYVKSLEKLSPTPEQIKASERLTEAWVSIGQAIRNVFDTMVRVFEPTIVPMFQQFASWIDSNRDSIVSTIKSWGDAFAKWVSDPATAQGFHRIVDDAERLIGVLDRLAQGKGLLSSIFGGGEGARETPHIITGDQGRSAAPDPDAGKSGGTFFSPNKLFEGSQHYDGARAAGGPVDRLRTYLVGEHGPELFTPGASGSITPNGGLNGDLQVDGRTVNRSNPIPVQLANGGSGGENWLQTALSFWGLSGGGGGGGGIGSVISNTVRAITGGGGGSGGSDAGAAARATSSPGVPLKGTSSELVAYIRESAIRHGIDPDVALRVARGEGGLLNPYRHGEGPAPRSQLKSLGPKENSYGPFQLYISGTGAGLGDRALKAGIDPRTNWKGGIDFALDEVRSKGWGQWYGARAAGITGMRGVGPLPANHAAPYKPSTFDGGARFAAAYHNTANDNRSTSTSTTINGGIHVTTAATDGKGTGAAVVDALRRAQVAQTANYGLR